MISTTRIGSTCKLMGQILKNEDKIMFQGRRCKSLGPAGFLTRCKESLAHTLYKGKGFTYVLNNYTNIPAITIRQRSLREIWPLDAMRLFFNHLKGQDNINERLKEYDVITLYINGMKTHAFITPHQQTTINNYMNEYVLHSEYDPEIIQKLPLPEHLAKSTKINKYFQQYTLIKLPTINNYNNPVYDEESFLHRPELHKTENPDDPHFHFEINRHEVESIVKTMITDNEPESDQHFQQFQYSRDKLLSSQNIKGILFNDGSYSQNEVSTSFFFNQAPSLDQFIKLSEIPVDKQAKSQPK